MASQGPNLAGSADNVDNGFDGWFNTSNATAHDGSTADFGFVSDTETDYLYTFDYGFSVPSAATVDGIYREIKKDDNNTAGEAFDAHVYLTKDGSTPGAEDKADTGTPWPDNLTWIDYGGPSDLWNDTWSPADVNASTFGGFISASAVRVSGNFEARVDADRITIYYTDHADHLTFSVQPTNAIRNASITPAIQVQARFSSEAVDTTYTGEITLAIENNPASGTLSGDTANNAAAGVASFSGLSIDNAGDGYTLAASASGLAGDESDAFDILAIASLIFASRNRFLMPLIAR